MNILNDKKASSVFRGTATALITPFSSDGKVDYESLGKILEKQVESGVEALVINGSTGESCCLTAEERRKNVAFTVRTTGGGIPIVAGVGCNCSALAVEYAREACGEGASAVLAAPPYFNKASPEGIIAHFNAIADASDVPVIVYDVPSRTGMKLDKEIVFRLFEHPNIKGIKEADCDVARATAVMSGITGKAVMYSGGDDMITPLLSIGAEGAISVVSNIFPKLTGKICRSFFAGDLAESRRLQLLLAPLICELFTPVNPIPIKALMARNGLCENRLRLPLTPLDAGKSKKLFAVADSLYCEEEKCEP